MKHTSNAAIILAITIITYTFTLHPAIQPYLFRLFVFYLVFSLDGVIFYAWARHRNVTTRATTLIIYMFSVTILFFVGMTGWFMSPFFYLFYVLAVLYAFMFSPQVSFVFVVALIGLYLPFSLKMPILYNAVTIGSLLMIVPVINYLQKKYLSAKQTENKIVILEQENQRFKNKADEFLNNKVTKISFNVRALASDIRQIALYREKGTKKIEDKRQLKKIVTLSNTLLKQIGNFEEKTTGRKLAHHK